MAWETPKTNWGQPGQTVPGADDFNRIEGNIDILGKYDRAPGYGTATGTNTKAITLSPAPSSYYEGLCFAFKNSTENTGAVTINVNGLGAKSVKKPNGNDLVAGNLKAGSVYTVRYNGTNFILQGSDSSGDAMPEHVLAGKTFSNDDGPDQTGTMPNNGSQTATLTISGSSKPTISIPAGYTSGGTITAQVDSSKAGIIKLGETLGGCEGSYGEINRRTTTLVGAGINIVHHINSWDYKSVDNTTVTASNAVCVIISRGDHFSIVSNYVDAAKISLVDNNGKKLEIMHIYDTGNVTRYFHSVTLVKKGTRVYSLAVHMGSDGGTSIDIRDDYSDGFNLDDFSIEFGVYNGEASISVQNANVEIYEMN